MLHVLLDSLWKQSMRRSKRQSVRPSQNLELSIFDLDWPLVQLVRWRLGTSTGLSKYNHSRQSLIDSLLIRSSVSDWIFQTPQVYTLWNNSKHGQSHGIQFLARQSPMHQRNCDIDSTAATRHSSGSAWQDGDQGPWRAGYLLFELRPSYHWQEKR